MERKRNAPHLTTNPLLEGFIDFYKKTALDSENLETVARRFQQTPEYFLLESYSFTNLIGFLSETHLRLLLERYALEFGPKVLLDPIVPLPRPEKTEFSFTQNHSNTQVRRTGKRNYCEYDEVVVFNELPSVFEVKLKTSFRTRGKRNTCYQGLNYYLRRERVAYVLRPIQEYFQTDNIAYIFIVLPEIFKRGGIRLDEFVERGGILVPFPLRKKKYKKRLGNLVEKWEKQGDILIPSKTNGYFGEFRT